MQVEAARVTSVGGFQSWCGAPHLPSVDSSWGLLGTVRCTGKQCPEGCVITEQKPLLSLDSFDTSASRSALRYSAPWEMLHSCSKSQGCAGDYGVLGLQCSCPGSFIPACSVHWRSQENLKPKYPFRRLLSFLFQAGWIAVSELSIIIRIEQWSLLLPGSFSEPRCAGFIIISQG